MDIAMNLTDARHRHIAIHDALECWLWSEAVPAILHDGEWHAAEDEQAWQDSGEQFANLDDLGFTVEDIHPDVVAQVESELIDIWQRCADEGLDISGIEPGQFGHDFILTRNRHGAGFWDRGLGVLGEKLSDMAQDAGTLSAFVTADDQIRAQ